MDEKTLGAELPRIAMVSTHGYVAANPPLGAADTGGQVVYVIELSKKLADLGYQVDIWTRRFEDQPDCEPVTDRVRILRVPCGGSDFIRKEILHRHIDEWVENALRFINRHDLRYQFVNSHYWDAGIAAQDLADSLSIPHIHTPHSIGLWKQRQMETDSGESSQALDIKYNFTTRFLREKRLYAEADIVLATTPVQIDLLMRDYEVPRDKLRMVPPGYDDNRFYPVGEASRSALRQRFGFHGKTVLSLGRLARNKGYDLLISAFHEVLQREPDAHLHLAVGGELMSENEKNILRECQDLASSLGISDKIHFSGYVSDDDLPDLYRAADVFVLSSRYEPFGMTAVEAMACGAPVVATTHGGLYRILRFGVDGLFADTFDAADLGITIVKPLRHPRLAQRLSRAGSLTARTHFTWTGIAQQIIRAVEHRYTAALSLDELETGGLN